MRRPARGIGRFTRILMAGVLMLAATSLTAPLAHAAGDPCATPVTNKVACENSKPGTPVTDWYSPNAWGDIQGFTSHESYKPGDTVEFKVQSPVSYQIEIYRLGWYQGDRARKMPSSPTATFPARTQPNCLSDAPTGLVDCGNWSTTVTWTVPSDAVSGLYLANIEQSDGNGVMPYPIVIRDESSHSGIVVQTSDETWQAYNNWGGQNLYNGSGPAPDGRAYKVSYNRPLDIGADNGIYGSEYAMISWLERNGYDVSYLSGIDVSTKGVLLQNHKVFMSNGHDEYWNQAQRDNVTAAKAAGVNLAFFSANEMFWRTRFEPSLDSSGTANRTLVCYKETKLQIPGVDGVPDPSGQWTGTWMDPTGAGKGGGKPQNALTGQLFRVNGYRNDTMTVPAAYGKLRMWRNTSIATLPAGQVATFPTGTLGYEWDVDEDNGSRPPGSIDLSSTTVSIQDGNYLLDNGNTYGNGTATHSPTLYRDPVSKALVFGAGTVQWSWGLDTLHVGNTTAEDPRMQQATVNLLADMGVQPSTLQSGLVAATASTELTGPTVSVTAPAAGVTVPVQKPVTVSGTAADLGGGQVARVEVSVDGGTTWKGATGTTSWTYTWTPLVQGSTQIQVRGVNDSVNTGTVASVPLTVGPQQCPCTVWPTSAVPTHVDSGDGGAIELGVKFRTSANGSITGVRFYKSALNTGTHTGSLWSTDGTRLATGTFTGETASGWQQLVFATPVPVKANTTYIASYYAPNGHYSYDDGCFTSQGAGLDPIKALMAGADGDNALYRYNTGGGFPNSSYHSSNYWVDAVLDTSGDTTTPPTVTAITPAAGATGVAITAAPTATFSHTIDTGALQFTLTGGGSAVPGTVSYNSATATATLRPTGQLALNTTYTATVQASDPWGNPMSAPRTWSFTTSATPPTVTCPCSLWDSATAPASSDSGDSTAVELGTRFSSSISGWITGVRFYKSVANTGTHTATLWSNTGTQLATGTFTGETASGWQQLTFTTPVAITANTTYVVSYFAPKGHYSATSGYFTAGYSAYPMKAPADGAGGANGSYRYGSTGFPTSTFQSTNYWVDPVFTNVKPPNAPSASLQLPLLSSLLTPLERLLGGLLGWTGGPTTAVPGTEPGAVAPAPTAPLSQPAGCPAESTASDREDDHAVSTVSVVIPCYKYGHYLADCVSSVLDEQPGVDVRVLIIDDCSPDDSAEAALKLAAGDPRIEVRVHEVNKGHIATYNEGLLEWADGDYTVLLSADDRLTPGALTRAVGLLDAHPEVGFVYGHPIHFQHGRPLPPARTELRGTTVFPGKWWLERRFKEAHGCITSPEVVVRTSLQREVGGYDPELPHAGDIEMWMRLASRADVGYLRGVDQAYYRKHGGNMSATEFGGQMDDLRQCKAAYDAVVTGCADHLPDAARLADTVNRKLARFALRRAVRAYDRGRTAEVPEAELVAFAADCWPAYRSLPEYRGLQLRRKVGARVMPYLQPLVLTAVVAKGREWLWWRSWRLRGI